MKTKRAKASTAPARAGKRATPMWMHVFSTIGMIGIAAAAAVGAWLGFQSGGLGIAFLGMLLGGSLGYFATYVLGNVLHEMMPLIRVLLVLGIIAATVYVLHLLGVQLGINPR